MFCIGWGIYLYRGDRWDKKAKKGKATAFDAITNDLIKSSGNIIAPFLTKLFNKLIFFQHFPVHWSTGLIVPIWGYGRSK